MSRAETSGISTRMLGTPPSMWASCTPSSAMRFTSEMRLPARKFSPSRFSASDWIFTSWAGFTTEMIVSKSVRSPCWMYWPIECRSAVSVTLAGKMPLPSLPSLSP